MEKIKLEYPHHYCGTRYTDMLLPCRNKYTSLDFVVENVYLAISENDLPDTSSFLISGNILGMTNPGPDRITLTASEVRVIGIFLEIRNKLL